MSGVLKIWNGSSWEEIEISAPVGPQGPTGPTGPIAGSANQVVYKDGSNNPTGSANLTFDGTRLSAAALTVDTNTLYVDATNDRVGLGTSSPGRRLSVYGISGGLGYQEAFGIYNTSGTLVIDFQANNTVYGPLVQFPTASGGFDMYNYRFFGADGTHGYKWTTKAAGNSSLDRIKITGNADTAVTSIINSTVGIGVTGPSSQFHVAAGASTTIGAIVQGAASQSANLQEWQNSSGTILASMSAAGAFSATTKSFDIEHPTKPNMRLQYGSVEAPEHSVQVRGRSNNKIINLPEHWAGLVDSDSITVQLTSIGSFQELFVKDFNSSIVEIGGPEEVDFFYLISAERIDVPKLVVEYGS